MCDSTQEPHAPVCRYAPAPTSDKDFDAMTVPATDQEATTALLDSARARLGIRTDRELAELLGVRQTYIAHARRTGVILPELEKALTEKGSGHKQ